MFNYRDAKPEDLNFVTVAAVGDLAAGQRLRLEIDDRQIVVFHVSGEYFALADLCSHDEGPLGEGELDGHELECPRHGARFDLRNGKALTLPAVADIPAYPVRIQGNEIQVGLPR